MTELVVTVVQSQPVVVTRSVPNVETVTRPTSVVQVVNPQPVVVEVETDPNDVDVVEVQAQGPQGAPGSNSNSSIVRLANQALGGHRVVRATSATHCDYADHADTTHGDDTLGVTSNAAAAGDQVNIVTEASIQFVGWAWTPGLPVFLGANGVLTQTEPSTGFVQVIGFAEAADTLFVDIQPAFYFD